MALAWVMRVVQSFLSPIVQSFPSLPFLQEQRGSLGQSRERVCVRTVTYVRVGLIGRIEKIEIDRS